MTPDGDADPAALRDRLAQLEQRLAAKTKVADVLIRRARHDQSGAQSSYKVFRDNVALQRVMGQQVTEIIELRRSVEAASREREHQLQSRHALERSLADAVKLEALGRLAGGIAHEINTPAQYVGDNLRFLAQSLVELAPVLDWFREQIGARADTALPDQVRSVDVDFLAREMVLAIDQSLDGMRHVATIVRSMKEFSHPGTKTKVLVDVNHALESALTVGRSEWKYVAESACEFDPDLPQIEAYPADLNQVFLNMIVNAAHAIEERHGKDNGLQGRLVLRTRQAEGSVGIEFEDNGCGMTPEVQARVFEPFFTTKPVGKGTGQGLNLVHQVIVDRHRGRIECSSQPGVGTRFVLWLPIKANEAVDGEAP